MTYSAVSSIGEPLSVGIPAQTVLILVLRLRARLGTEPSGMWRSAPARPWHRVLLANLPDQNATGRGSGDECAIWCERNRYNGRFHGQNGLWFSRLRVLGVGDDNGAIVASRCDQSFVFRHDGIVRERLPLHRRDRPRVGRY